MSKLEQVLILDPPYELKFTGPFEDVVSSTLKLSNPTDRKICFKVKTTAPRRYCVRPNSGIIEPRMSVSVAVMLQPFKYDPNEKNKHKFMVQSVFAPDVEFNLETLFKEADLSQLMDSKLRCVFEMPEDNQSQPTTEPMYVPATKPAEIREALKSSPKTVNSEYELRKAVDEIKKLREEASVLRQENLKLREETIRFRNISSDGVRHHAMTGSGMPNTILPQPQQQGTPFTQYAIVVMIALLGYIIGKYIL